jgi:hypothetical protein
VLADEPFDRVAAERAVPAAGEQGAVGPAAEFCHPGAQDRGRLRGERGAAFFAPLAVAAQVRSLAEAEVLAAQADEFGHPKAALEQREEQGVVAAAGPGCPVRGGQEGLGLTGGEERDDRLFEALAGDGEHALDDRRVGRLAHGGVPEQGVDRGEPGVAGPGAVSPSVLEVVEEGPDQRRVEVGELEPGGRRARSLLGEGEQEPERVPVGGDRVRAHLPLGEEPLGEERFQDRGKRAHGSTPREASSRLAAKASSSGLPDRYQ